MCAIGLRRCFWSRAPAITVGLVRGRLGVGRADHARRLVARGHGADAARGPLSPGGQRGRVAGVHVAVGRWLGGGLGAILILASATAGNLLTAVRHHTNHDSVGASTATFAALGLVAGLQVARRLRLRTRPGYAWVPIGAGLGLFAMLGVAAGSDYWAHLFGLGFGVLFGVGWAIAQLKRGWKAPRRARAGAAGRRSRSAIVAGCWWLAFHRAG